MESQYSLIRIAQQGSLSATPGASFCACRLELILHESLFGPPLCVLNCVTEHANTLQVLVFSLCD